MSNYYLLLGIEKDADLGKIKQAYRFYCKKYHPDLSLTKEKNKFLKIQEAYETLSDKEKRRVYDNSLERKTESVPINFADHKFREEKNGIRSKTKRFSSLMDEFFEGFVPGFFEENFSGNKELYLELILSPEEARRGGIFPIEVPLIEDCSFCLGKGYVKRFICTFCNGTGTINKERSFSLHIPSNISSHTHAKVSLEGIGLPHVYLNVEVIVF